MEPLTQFPQDWLAPSELSGDTPRGLKLTGWGIFLIALAGLCFVGAVALFVIIWNAGEHDKRLNAVLRQQGVPATASILHLWRQGDSATPKVCYEFDANGRHMEETLTVPRDLWNGLREGAPLPVRYLPSDPSVNHPSAWEEKPLPLWLNLLLTGIFAATGGMMLWLRLPELRLVRDGVPAPGIVTKVTVGRSGCYVSYTFQQRDGTEMRGWGNISRPPAIGQVITVLYNPERPGKNRPYPGSLYRVRPL